MNRIHNISFLLILGLYNEFFLFIFFFSKIDSRNYKYHVKQISVCFNHKREKQISLILKFANELKFINSLPSEATVPRTKINRMYFKIKC